MAANFVFCWGRRSMGGLSPKGKRRKERMRRKGNPRMCRRNLPTHHRYFILYVEHTPQFILPNELKLKQLFYFKLWCVQSFFQPVVLPSQPGGTGGRKALQKTKRATRPSEETTMGEEVRLLLAPLVCHTLNFVTFL